MSIDSYETPEREALLHAVAARSARAVIGRERITHAVASGGFLAAAAALAVVAPWQRPSPVWLVALLLAVYVVAEGVRFPVGGGWSVATQLVFVPMLFVLPAPVVPLLVCGGALASRLPELVRGRTSLGRTLTAFGDSWYALGPALVLVLAGWHGFAWSHWPVYVAALAAQFGFDLAATTGRCWFAERIRPSVQLPLVAWIYVVDAGLASVGLVLASQAVVLPGLVLLALPLIGILALFARERRERLDQVVALSSAYLGTALLLGDVVEADDAYTGSHSRGVLDLSLGVADALGLDPTRRRNVEFGALLHDVGKVRVPKEIINKPGPLDDDEWEIMRRHTVEGEAMLAKVGGMLSDVGRVVRSSHEHYNGGGYPDGLAGEQIPLESRIVTACDAYSAMTTDRPYRRGRPASEALAELERCAGSQFDPQVVAALRDVLSEEVALFPKAETEIAITPAAAAAQALA